MRLKHCFLLLMVVLFLFTFQKITIHSKEHLAQVAAECHLCNASEHLDIHQQQKSSPPVVNEYFAIKESKVEEKQIIQATYDLTQKPLIHLVDLEGLVTVGIDRPSLGYLSTAPPYTFS